MRIYVAGKTDDWERVRRVQEMCRRLGHTITYDWTQNVEEVHKKHGRDGLKGVIPDEDRRRYAIADRQGVREAQLLIMVCYTGLCGTLIEFGIAAEREINIWVVGTPERDSVFFELPRVTRFKDEYELVDHL